MEGLARAGNGMAEFVKEGERMQPKVLYLVFIANVASFYSDIYVIPISIY